MIEIPEQSTAKHGAQHALTSKCSVKGHFSSSCSKCTACSSWGHRDNSSRWCPHNARSKTKNNDENLQVEDDSKGALYSQLCATENNSSCNASKLKPMEHHIFEGKWIVRPSKPHPVLAVQLTPVPQDQQELGHPLKASNLSSVSIPIVLTLAAKAVSSPSGRH